MRVALDVTATITGSTGVARYANQLTAALADQGVETVPYAIGRARHPVPAGVRHVSVPLRVVHQVWSRIGRPRAEWIAKGADLVHALDLVPPPSNLPVVLTLHDVTAIDHPEFHPARRATSQRAQLAAARRAQAVLCVSHATARAAVAHGVDRARIVVSPLGRTSLPNPPSHPTRGRPYLLVVGEVSRRKGHDVLLEAFAAADLDGIELVVAGPDGFDATFRDALVHQLGIGPRVSFLGYVDDATLAGLYAGALALCFPSRAEGFGLPVIEALGLGVPVVASDLDVVREVAGDSVVYVPPGDSDGLASALQRIVDDGDLRAALTEAGPVAAATFTWERTARATIDAYHLALS